MTRRIHSILLLFALLIGGAGMNYVQAEEYSGTCGAAGYEAKVKWELDTETGRLYISGSGPMTHYWSLQDIPWFNYRQYITNIYVYPGVTAIGHHAFYDCSNVTYVSLYSDLISIGVLSFGFCRKLTSLEIPATVTSIGEKALWYNESLREVHVVWTGDAVPAMPADIHNFEASQIRLHIPCGQTAAYVAKGWDTKFTLIEGLYVGTMETTTNYFPWVLTCDSVWRVSGTGALNDFPNPMYAVVGGLRATINISRLSPVFGKSEKVKEAVFEEGITYIGNNTFYKGTYHSGYHYLTTLTLPSTLTSMSSSAFKGCIALKDVYVSWTTAAAIPTWNQSIDVSSTTLHVPCGTTAFYQAKGWQDFIIKEEPYKGTCGAQGDNLIWELSCDGTLTIRGTGAMVHYWSYPDIPWWNYRGSIQRIVIEEGVTTIGNHAFVQCSNLTSVSLPNTLTAISYLAFGHCIGLPSLTIPSSVTSMADMFIHNTQSLTDVYVSWTGDDVPTMPADIHQFDASHKQLHIPCGQAGAYYAKGWNNRFTLPGVTSGTCGDNVQWTFESCNGTLSIFGTGPMANYGFAGTPWYSYSPSITSVIIANGVTSIGNYAFLNGISLQSVSIPSSVTSIGHSAFDRCYSLTSVVIPNSVTSIESYTFYMCTSLASISIPNSITTIGQQAFAYCDALTSVTIPNSVTTIDQYALINCDLLTDIYVSWANAATIPLWHTLTNINPQSSVTLHVPCSAMSLYQAADGWKDYTIEGEGHYTITVESDDPTMGTVDAIKIEN